MRKISRRSFLKAATVACVLTALTACGGGDESAAVSVAKDENGAYVDTLTITLGRFAEPGHLRRLGRTARHPDRQQLRHLCPDGEQRPDL